jgi:hypothetical protein
MALVDRTAYPRLPSTVSGRELAEALTPTAGEVRWACAKIVDPGARLSLLVLLKCYQRWVRLVWRDWLTCRVDGWAAAATCCLLLLRQEQGGGLDGVADR